MSAGGRRKNLSIKKEGSRGWGGEKEKVEKVVGECRVRKIGDEEEVKINDRKGERRRGKEMLENMKSRRS